MKKSLSEKQCFNRLEKYFKEHFTDEQLDRAEFWPDLDGDMEHAWKFKLDSIIHLLTISKISGSITHQHS